MITIRRDARVIKRTKSRCPACGVDVPATVVERGGAVDDVQPGVPVDPVVGVDHAGPRGVADRAAAEEVRGHGDVEDLAGGAVRAAVDLVADPAHNLERVDVRVADVVCVVHFAVPLCWAAAAQPLV